MKLVFFGTPYYVIPVLEMLRKTFRTKSDPYPVVAVVTQKPKPTGRKHEMEFSAVDSWAHSKGIPIFFDPADLIKSKISADLGVLASFGQILGADILGYFRWGIINLHPSLLPKFRGASPVQGAIVSGETVTGLSFTKMDASLDKGDLISQFKEDVGISDTTQTLRDRLFMRAAEVIATLIPAYMSGKTNQKKLSHHPGTFTKHITKDDAFIPINYLNSAIRGKSLADSWSIAFISNYKTNPTPLNIHNLIRAMDPWPVAWTKINVKGNELRMKILKSHIENSDGLKLVLDEVLLEGKSPVSWKQFQEGYPDFKLGE